MENKTSDYALNEKLVDIDKEKISSYLEEKNWAALTCYFDNTFKIVLDSASQEPIKFAYSVHIINTFQVILENLVNESNQLMDDDAFLAFSISLFRALRNYTLSKITQDALVDNETIVPNSVKFLEVFIANIKYNDKYSKNIKIILQFLSNLTIFSTNKQNILLSLHFLITELLNNSEFVYITSALLYNVLKDTKLDLKVIDKNMYYIILDKSTQHQDNEYLNFIIVELLQNSHFYDEHPNYKHEHKLIILDTIKENLYEAQFKLDEKFIDILSEQFKSKCNKILLTANKTESDEKLEAVEVNYLLDILASMSGTENYMQHLQNDKTLLENCAKLLEVIQCLGKMDNNCFTAVQKLADITNPNENIKTHPAFGFKAALIRILGNMCWKNKDNQDQLRKLGTISLLLDCCNIDARNPFIMQWAILAVRNLCESNVENQKFIASLTQQGVVSSAVLHEMGLSLHSDGSNQITIVPLDTLKDLQNKHSNT